MGENKNLFLALGLSVLVMIGYDQLVLQPQMEEAQQRAQEQAAINAEGDGIAPAVSADALAPAANPATDLAPAGGNQPSPAAASQYKEAGRVAITTPELMGSLSLAGARFDDLMLVNHKTTIEKDAANIALLKNANLPDGYFIRYGWAANGKGPDFVPGENTVWTTNSTSLSPDTPVTLTWDNGQGVLFGLTVSVDDRFMFSVSQTVENTSGEAIQVAPYGLINRRGNAKN